MIFVSDVRVRNLRSLVDTGLISLKPINILVGRNSSGKSTFARFFPLLKQSFEVSKKGPVLWWGRLVDFGAFESALNRSAQPKEIGFAFKMRYVPSGIKLLSYAREASIYRAPRSGDIEIDLTMMDGGSDSGVFISKILFKLFDITCEISLDKFGWVDSIVLPNYRWSGSSDVRGYGLQDRLIPSFNFFKLVKKDGADFWEPYKPFDADLFSAIGDFVHGKTSGQKIKAISRRILIGSYQDIFDQLMRVTDPPSFKDHLIAKGVESTGFKRLCEIFLAANVNRFLDEAYQEIAGFSKGINYLEPLRATALRYYRQQSLAVGEIDSKGENIAMFFDSLSYFQRDGFNKWASDLLGFKVLPKREGGHISLTIQLGNEGVATNIADMGFGFSQMLPIASQLWVARHGSEMRFPTANDSASRVMVIEQPELHLHPEYQAKLADIFVAAVAVGESGSYLNTRLKIFAETHSPALINRLGELVAQQKINRDDVQVVLFDQETPNSATCIRISSFNDEGVLVNWPIGFFEPSVTF